MSEKEQINMIIFKKNEIIDILNMLNVKTEKKGRWTYVFNSNNQLASCNSCKKPITTYNLGNILNDGFGNPFFLCTNPICFAHFVVDRTYYKEKIEPVSEASD